MVLLDWKMPVMDGGQTLTRLREMRPDIKVVISSGLAQSHAEARFREARIDGYLQKPYHMSDLVQLVEKPFRGCGTQLDVTFRIRRSSES